jgi:carbonic anhydrase
MNAQTDGESAPDASDPAEAGGPGSPYLPQRREALFLIGGGVLGAALGGGTVVYTKRSPGDVTRDDKESLSEREGREVLEAGNVRFASGVSTRPDQSVERRKGVVEQQAPFAAILCCSDSRVPPEMIFDQGLGDLFVVRSGGQVVDHAVMGSLQYGVSRVKTPLLVVLGHSDCGVVRSAVESLEKKSKPTDTDIDTLVAAIVPAVREAEESGAKKDNLVSVSTDLNVERIVEQLKAAAVLQEASTLRKVKIVGAVYSLDTGRVNWL